MASVNEELRSRAISHAIYLERYKSGVWKKLSKLLDRADADIVRQLVKRGVDGDFTAHRLGLLLDAVQEMNAAANLKFREALRAELRAIGKYELNYQQRLLESTLPQAIVVDLGVVAPTVATVYSAAFSRPFQGRLLRDWAASIEKARLVKVQEAIRIGIVEGETVDQIVRRVRGTKALKYKDGALQIARRNAEAVVRTAVNHTVTQAREEFYTANSSLIKGWQFVATLDSRTCFAAGTLVRTPGGLRPIEAIQPGDLVIGGSGQPRKVLAAKETTTTNLVRVRLSNGECIVCTADHLFLKSTGDWQEAGLLSDGEKLATRLE